MTTLLWQFLVPFCFLQCVCWGIEITQEKMMVGPAGKEVVILCKHDDNSYLTMLWYQQKKDQGLKLLTYSVGKDSNDIEDKDNAKKWSTERPEILMYYLKIANPGVEDSAVYFCAARDINYQAYFGEGTILAVLGEKEKQIDPKVRIFPPDKQEFKEHGLISLVCVATGFFPEHVRLTWYLNGEKIESLYQNEPKIDNDKTYSTSSRLSLTESQYFNPDTKIRCEAAFVGSNSSASDETYGELGCGVSKESYGRYMNQGKISYIMVLFKSGLYAVIVLAVIRRRKALSGSC